MCNMSLFKCPLCEVACANKSNLLSHVDNHDGFPLSCIKCCSTFKNKFSYDYHLSSELCKKSKKQVGLLRQCPECPQTFINRRHFIKHVEGHRRNNCQYCDARPTTKKELTIHMAQEHKIKLQKAKYQCQFCERCFVKQVTLFNHYNHHANGKFVCQGCGVFLDTKEEFEAHREKHEQERPWKCTRCATTFSRRQQYLVHMVSHEKYQCKTCNMGFAAKATLQEHVRACMNNSGKESQHECPECGKIFSRESQLKLHIKAHTGEEAYTCLVCKESFQTASEYNQHIEVTCHKVKENNPEKPYECEQCEKRFPHDYLLVEHMNRIHGATRSYKCKYCDHTSNSRVNMARHQALHTERRRFVCDQCGAAFHAHTTLKDHCTSVHSEQRQFSCITCSKTFKLQSDLRRHIRSHSDTHPFKCQNCNQSYKRAFHLRRHEKASHGMVYKPRKLQRLEQDENGVLVPVVEETKSSSNITKDTKPVAVTVEQQPQSERQWSAPISSENSVFTSPVLSLVDADSGKVITLQELCADGQILTTANLSTAEILSLPTDDQLTAIVSCPETTLDTFQSGNVMQAIEVPYDLSFATPQTLTTVFSSSEPQLVFAAPITMSLDQNQTVLAVSQIQTSDCLDGKVQLLETDISKLPDTIFIEDSKLESMEEPMLLESTEPAPHITIENFTALQTDGAELDSMLQLPDEVLPSGSLLRNRLISGPKLDGVSLPPLSHSDTMSSLAQSNTTKTNSSSLPINISTLSASPTVPATSVDISGTNNVISIPDPIDTSYSDITINHDSPVTTLSIANPIVSSPSSNKSSVSPIEIHLSEPGILEETGPNVNIPSMSIADPLECSGLDEEERTTTTLSALPVDQECPESDDTAAISTLSVDALDVSISDADIHPSCTISIQPQEGSTDLVLASLDMHPDPSLSQADEAAVASANLMAEFLPQNFPFLNVE